MTKAQKSLYKTLKKDKHREAFVQMLARQQEAWANTRAGVTAYARKCAKKRVTMPV